MRYLGRRKLVEVGGGGGGGRGAAKCIHECFSKNYVEIRKYNIDLQTYIDFIVNRNRAILVMEWIHDFRNGGR